MSTTGERYKIIKIRVQIIESVMFRCLELTFFCFVFTHSKIEVYLNRLTSRWSSSSSCYDYDAEIDTGDLKPTYYYL